MSLVLLLRVLALLFLLALLILSQVSLLHQFLPFREKRATCPALSGLYRVFICSCCAKMQLASNCTKPFFFILLVELAKKHE